MKYIIILSIFILSCGSIQKIQVEKDLTGNYKAKPVICKSELRARVLEKKLATDNVKPERIFELIYLYPENYLKKRKIFKNKGYLYKYEVEQLIKN